MCISRCFSNNVILSANWSKLDYRYIYVSQIQRPELTKQDHLHASVKILCCAVSSEQDEKSKTKHYHQVEDHMQFEMLQVEVQHASMHTVNSQFEAGLGPNIILKFDRCGILLTPKAE